MTCWRKKRRTLITCPVLTRVALGLLFAAVPSAAFAAGPCSGPGPGSRADASQAGWTNVVPGNGSGQVFTATRPRITGVEVYVVTGNPREDASDTLTLTLSTPRGDQLAEVEATVESGQAGWLCFPMPQGGVDVGRGETLVLHLRDTGKVVFGWRYGKPAHAPGHALMLNRADPRFDFAFHVHDATARPAS
jgi:hypothetical protein